MKSVSGRLIRQLTAGAVVLAVSSAALVGLSGGVASGTQTPTLTAAEVTYVVNPVTTVTRLTVTQGSPAVEGTFQTLTAMVAPLAAAGSVQFNDCTDNIGSPVPVSNGTATTITGLALGTLTDRGAHPHAADVDVRLVDLCCRVLLRQRPHRSKGHDHHAQSGPEPRIPAPARGPLRDRGASTAAGTVQFEDGTTGLGAPVPVVGGCAFSITTTLATGTHTLTAVFTPANPAVFSPST